MPLEIGGIYHFDGNEEGILTDGYPSYRGREMFAGMVLFNRSNNPARPSHLIAVVPVLMLLPYESATRDQLVLWRDFEFATGYATNTGLLSRYPRPNYPNVLRSFLLATWSEDEIDHLPSEDVFRLASLSTWWIDAQVQADAHYFGLAVSEDGIQSHETRTFFRKIPKSNSMFKVSKKEF